MISTTQRRAILARSPIGTTHVHRGVTLTRAWGGHVNASTDDGFIGGYVSFAAARRAVDDMCARAEHLAQVRAGSTPIYATVYGRRPVRLVVRFYRRSRA